MNVSLMLSEVLTKEDAEVFQLILSKISTGHVIGTLRQAMAVGDGTYTYTDIQEEVAEQNCLIRISDEYLYVTFINLNKMVSAKFKSLFNLMLERGTYAFKNRQPNDYVYTVDVIHNELEHGYTYMMTGVQPIFISSDGDKDMTMVFEADKVRCQVVEVSSYDVEYIQALREEAGDTVHNRKDTEGIADQDDFTGQGEFTDDEINVDNGGDFVSTKSYTTGM